MDINFNVHSIQGSLFFSSLAFGSKLPFLNQLSKAVPILFEKDPTILPIPDDAPPDIPRIMLSDKKEEFQCNITANRINIFYIKNNELEPFQDTYSKFYPEYQRLYKAIKSNFNPQVNRLALVLKLIAQLTESSNQFLQRFFLKENTFNNPYSTELRFLYKEESNNFKINKWIKLLTLIKKDIQDNDTSLQLEIDINTLSEVIGDYSIDEIDRFYEIFSNKINEYVNQYFGAN